MTDKVYEFLAAPKETAAKIRRKRRQRAEKLAGMLPGAIRYDLPRVQSSPSDRMSQSAAEVDELDREIEELKALKRQQRQAIIDVAESLENEDAGRCIVLHYVDGLKWADVARAVHRSESTVFRWQREAVQDIDEKFT